MPELLFETRDHVATIMLNRPDRMNAISGDMLRGLSEALLRCNEQAEVRAVVLTGAGRGFCAGLDLKDAAANPGSVGGGMPAISEMPPLVMRRIDVPIVCALNGPAAGYGMDLALGCDFVLASERASFTPPVRRGVVPESGGTWLLPRLVGWHKACEITLLGRRLEAEDIERLGLCNRLLPHDRLAAQAQAWAEELARNAPLAVRAAKRTMRLGLEESFEANSYHVMSELLQLFHSEDFREGLASFLEKRAAQYQGR